MPYKFPCQELENRRRYYKNNSAKIRARAKKWYADHIGYRQNQNMFHKFGITLDEYNQMYILQDGVCAICGEKENRKNMYGTRLLSIDHDHKTGKIRGLLCANCNLILGNLKDDISLLKKCIIYLEKYRC